MRDHAPIELDNFQGIWDRGEEEQVPLDHLVEATNLIFKGNDLTVRPGVGMSQSVAVPLGNVKRIYNYHTQTANTRLVLTYDGVTGKIYHVVDASTTFGPILSIAGMEDFAFVPYAGRAYISPFKSFTTGDLNIQKGMQSEFLYVYKGDGTAARKAAGTTPAGTLTIANGAAGNTDAGFHLFGVVGETDTGFQSSPIAIAGFTTAGNLSVSFSTVPLFSGSQWIKRHIVATIKITNYNGNTTGYKFFFIPNATINDNVTTALSNISFFDADLLEDASHLLDNYTEIPAGAALSIYHDRLVLSTTFSNISIALISAPGEPEAINTITGIIIVPLDGNPITNHRELRDVLYMFKRARCVAYVDNGDEPSTWQFTVIDNALGTSVHGIAEVLDSGSSNVDFLIVSTYAGVILFNGRFVMPELTWKIQNLWQGLDRNYFNQIQIANDPIRGWILIVLPDSRILVGDYNNGMDNKKIRWTSLTFHAPVNCVCIVNIDEITIGMDIPF